jgi:Glucose-6-phosphate dehydrogenase, NAD binding domain
MSRTVTGRLGREENMNTTHQHRASSQTPGAGPRPADVLVVFGITGDLARVMTFNSLYRLEARGLLSHPIVGVAADDWTDGRGGSDSL